MQRGTTPQNQSIDNKMIKELESTVRNLQAPNKKDRARLWLRILHYQNVVLALKSSERPSLRPRLPIIEAMFYEKLQQYKSALNTYDICMFTEPKNFYGYAHAAVLLQSLRRYTESADIWDKMRLHYLQSDIPKHLLIRPKQWASSLLAMSALYDKLQYSYVSLALKALAEKMGSMKDDEQAFAVVKEGLSIIFTTSKPLPVPVVREGEGTGKNAKKRAERAKEKQITKAEEPVSFFKWASQGIGVFLAAAPKAFLQASERFADDLSSVGAQEEQRQTLLSNRKC